MLDLNRITFPSIIESEAAQDSIPHSHAMPCLASSAVSFSLTFNLINLHSVSIVNVFKLIIPALRRQSKRLKVPYEMQPRLEVPPLLSSENGNSEGICLYRE